MEQRTGRGLAIALLLLAAAGCGTVRINTGLDPTAHFDSYHTFNFQRPAAEKQTPGFTPEVQELVEIAIQREFEVREIIPSAQPDLLVGFYLSVQEKKFDLQNPTSGQHSVSGVMADYFGFTYRSGQDLNHMGEIPYEEGTLVIDVADARTGRLVWQGLAKGVLYRDETPDQIKHRVNEAVRKMFDHYPR